MPQLVKFDADRVARSQGAAEERCHAPRRKEVLVRLHNIQKTYDGETLVVKGVDLDIYRGEFLTILGPSGSGKTTCLHILAGFETATRGEITLDGISIKSVPSYRRDFGVVFQNYALFPHMTIAENLAFPLTVRRKPKAYIAERVRWALEMVRLPDVGGRRPGQLSGGQQQRIAVARALVFEPKLLLMDEPLGALDKQLREQMQYEIKQLHETLKVTVVYVTHDQTEAMAMSDRIAVFNNGGIQQIGAPEDIYERPANSFIANFIGENNQLRGVVRNGSGPHSHVELLRGGKVLASPVDAVAPEMPVTLALRPERVLLGAEATRCDNVFTAQVRDVTYLGDVRRIRVSIFEDVDLIARAHVGFNERLLVGQVIKAGWNAADCRAFSA